MLAHLAAAAQGLIPVPKCHMNFPSCLLPSLLHKMCQSRGPWRHLRGRCKGFWSGVCSLPLMLIPGWAFSESTCNILLQQQASPSWLADGHLEREGCSVHYLPAHQCSWTFWKQDILQGPSGVPLTPWARTQPLGLLLLATDEESSFCCHLLGSCTCKGHGDDSFGKNKNP